MNVQFLDVWKANDMVQPSLGICREFGWDELLPIRINAREERDFAKLSLLQQQPKKCGVMYTLNH